MENETPNTLEALKKAYEITHNVLGYCKDPEVSKKRVFSVTANHGEATVMANMSREILNALSEYNKEHWEGKMDVELRNGNVYVKGTLRGLTIIFVVCT